MTGGDQIMIHFAIRRTNVTLGARLSAYRQIFGIDEPKFAGADTPSLGVTLLLNPPVLSDVGSDPLFGCAMANLATNTLARVIGGRLPSLCGLWVVAGKAVCQATSPILRGFIWSGKSL
jgi:hypothetical protein